jgi:hypothetical protein
VISGVVLYGASALTTKQPSPTTTRQPVSTEKIKNDGSETTSTVAPRTVDAEPVKPGSSMATKHYSFLHMTDLHISNNRPFSLENLREFCNSTFPALTAEKDILFLALTGDFTDGMGDFLSLDQFGQQESDWTAFRLALEGCVKVGIPIFKIRGNHDAFGVHSFTHPTNLFFTTIQEEFNRLFSKHPNLRTLATHAESGSFAISHSPSKSRFVFLDAGRTIPSPHQYHGEFSESQAVWLKNLIQGPSNPQTARTYIFIHFPLGCLVPSSRARLLEAVAKSASRVTVLSGHIHSVVGRRGVQSIKSHQNVDELQLSDFKWSETVRKINVESGLFVDIPVRAHVSATLLLDPGMRSLVGVASTGDIVIDSVTPCHAVSSELRPETVLNGMHFFSLSDELSCVNVTTIDRKGKRESVRVPAVDTRLWPGTPGRAIFTHFFEALQLLLLFEYVLLVVIARALFLKFKSLPMTLYLVLSPVIPLTVSENFFSRPWVVSNGVAGLDLETQEIFLDFETIRMGIIMLLYLLFAVAVKANPGRFGRVIWTLFLGILTLFDMRMLVARGGVKTMAFSPHTWFMIYMWTLLVRRKVKSE